MAIESFEVSKTEEYGDLLTRKNKKDKLKIGFYASAYFEYYRMYPHSLETYIKNDYKVVLNNIKKNFGNSAEIIESGIVTTLDEADHAGKVFKESNLDLVIFCLFTYTIDVMSIQFLRYVENIPLLIFLRQSHKDIDFNSNYEQTLRNSSMIGMSQLTGTFKKMKIFNNFEVIVGYDNENLSYLKMKKYVNALLAYLRLRNVNIGIIGHVFRGMFDHEFDIASVTGILGPQIIDVQLSHLMDIWQAVSEKEIQDFIENAKWIRKYKFENVTENDFYKECKFTIAYNKLLEKFRLDAACYLGQHFIEVKTGCTGYLSNVFFAKEKKIMTNTEGDVLGLIMMCIMNSLTGQTPLFGEWGEFGIKENAMQIMMHGYADLDYAKNPSYVKITATPENWGFTGSGFSIEFTSKPGIVTIAHFIEDRTEGWRMLITRGEALDVEQSIPCEDVTLIFKPEIEIKEFIKIILSKGFDHHAVICYGDLTEELGYIADFMGIKKDIIY
jgi:L-arabinose isomerase